MRASDSDLGLRRRPTMNDVAAEAGVSQATVSVVLNAREGIAIAEATRQRVLDASARLGFRLNRAAQDLRLSRSSAIGIVANAIATAPFAGNILAGLQQAAREVDWACMIVEPGEGGTFDDATRSLLDRSIDRIVYATPATEPVHVTKVSAAAIAFANCWSHERQADGPVFLPDEANGGEQAAQILLEAGHRRLLVLAGTPGEWATEQRVAGLQRAAARYGLGSGQLPIQYGDYSIGSGYRLAREWQPRTSPTAILAGNDRMALGALLALDEMGLSVPDDVSLVGYDDQPDFADQLHPRLTTIAIPFRELGLQAGRVLSGAIESHLKRQLIPCRLVRRDSVAAPTAHH